MHDNYCDSTFFMWFAKSQIETIEPEPMRSALKKCERACGELAAIQTQINAAETELRHIFAVRSELFRQHQHQQRVLVELKRAVGLIR